MPPSRRASRAASQVVATIDFKKTYPFLYRASRRVEEIRSPKGIFLVVDGIGEPGGRAFQEAIHQLFTLAYTTKFAMKKEGGADFTIPALECLWPEDVCGKPMTEWRWRLMLRVPPCVKAQALKHVKKAILDKKGVSVENVRRLVYTEGRALQVLHVGPYAGVGDSYRKLESEAASRGLVCAGPPHELYLNDPRRVGPARTRTIVRMPVKRRSAS